MDIYKDILLEDCPRCQGPALLEEENGSGFYVMCLDCGCRTAEIEYSSEVERELAAQKAAHLWNDGKSVSSHPGE